MSTTKAERLREARKKAGFESASAAAEAFGWKPAAYRHHENGTRDFDVETAKRYGRGFKINPGYLLALDKIPTPSHPIEEQQESLEVDGSVAAGVWRESGQWERDRRFVIEGSPSVPIKGKRFGLQVEGTSMDEFYHDGGVLDCVSIFDTGVKPQTGDHVIVERTRPDGLRELTVKEFLEEGGHYFLVPRSTKPEHQARMEIGAPDHDFSGEERVQVIAYVVGYYPPRALNLMRRMGLIRTQH
jgi:phage repressor protein C with HTH and peptisase S24 domain